MDTHVNPSVSSLGASELLRADDTGGVNQIRHFRKLRGLSQEALGEAIGTTKAQINKLETGQRRLTQEWMVRLALPLGVSPGDLMLPAPPPPPVPPAEEASPIILDQDLSKARPINYPSNDTRDLPVLGTAMGGPNGYFEMQGHIIEHVWRPPHLATVKNAFALYVSGNSMAPRYEAGDLIYCRPGRHPRPGSYVVLEMHQESEGAAIMATIGRYRRQTASHVEIEKLSPASVQKVPAAKVKRIHIIAGTGES